MKNLIFKYYKACLFVVLSVFAVTSCEDNNNDDIVAQAHAPEITLISPAVDDNGNKVSPLQNVEFAIGGEVYIIEGKGFSSLKHIYFNDVESYFNPNMVTDTHIIITIDSKTPYKADQIKKLRLETGFGTLVKDFTIAPPRPVFNSFQPINAADGEEVTIYGNFFVNPIVKVGDKDASIISLDEQKMVVKLPVGSQDQKISVTTLSGTKVYGTAVGTAIFDDKFHAPWNWEDWNNHFYLTDQATAAQGLIYVGKKMSGWDNIQGNWNFDENATKKYTGIKFNVKSDGNGKLKFIFNGDWGEKFLFTTSKDWKEVRYTWKDLGNPAALQNISFQEFTGAETTYYFDNITYTVD